MRKLISIIIPSFNSALYIEETIRSATNQTYRPFEIIVVDDCSSDSTFEILTNLKGLGIKFRLFVNEENKGLGYTFNRGVSESIGEWIMAIGHDDLLPKDYLYRMSKLISPEISIIHSNHILIDKFNNPIPSIYFKKNLKSKYPFFFLSHENFISFIGILINKDNFLAVNGFDAKPYNEITDEHLLWVKLAGEGKIVFCNETKPFYRWHNQNLSHKISNLQWDALSIYSKSVSKENLYGNKTLLKKVAIFFILSFYILTKKIIFYIRFSLEYIDRIFKLIIL